MTEQVLVALLALVLAVWIARPLLGRLKPVPRPADRRTADLLEAKQSVYRSIVDLELDHEMGKLEQDDYVQLRQQSKAEALDILRQLDTGLSPESEQATLEDEIRAARERMRKR
ncbi:MAG TPA: hypothetical protein VHJ78_06485 [Actinomycetota bacterium]|nr:hypothetical protein [Actinomycetota bacterium]